MHQLSKIWNRFVKEELDILLQGQEQTVTGKCISVQLSSNGEAVSKPFIFGNFQKVVGWSFVSKIMDGILH